MKAAVSNKLKNVLPTELAAGKIESVLIAPVRENVEQNRVEIEQLRSELAKRDNAIKDLQYQINKQDARVEVIESIDRIGVMIIEGIKLEKGVKTSVSVIKEL